MTLLIVLLVYVNCRLPRLPVNLFYEPVLPHFPTANVIARSLCYATNANFIECLSGRSLSDPNDDDLPFQK